MNISVLVSCHNYRELVVEAIDSALAQSLPPLEVIVIDDGSTDGSGEMLEARYAGHPVVTVIRTPNRGQLATFVAAFRASRGDIVAFLDADDRWRPQYLERIAAVYRQLPSVDEVFCNMEQFGDAKGLWLAILHDEDLGTAAIRMWATQRYYGVPTSGISMRRQLAESIFRIPESYFPQWRTRADDCLVFGAALLGAHRYYIGDALIEYRFHGRNSWAGRTFPAVEVAQHRHRLNHAIAWYGQAASLDYRSLQWAEMEFRTKPKPRPGDFLQYLWLQWQAPMAPRQKMVALANIAIHYVLSLWKVKKILRQLIPRRA